MRPVPSHAFTAFPTSPAVVVPSAHLRVLLLRNLRLPVPCAHSMCSLPPELFRWSMLLLASVARPGRK